MVLRLFPPTIVKIRMAMAMAHLHGPPTTHHHPFLTSSRATIETQPAPGDDAVPATMHSTWIAMDSPHAKVAPYMWFYTSLVLANPTTTAIITSECNVQPHPKIFVKTPRPGPAPPRLPPSPHRLSLSFLSADPFRIGVVLRSLYPISQPDIWLCC